MNSLDTGSIKIFNRKVIVNEVKDGHRIGFMPQEMALVDELTVKETIFFFGNLYEMSSKALQDRYLMLRELLDLPPDAMQVKNCSGGEKRRISFTVAIIHKPELLILDEPTVGLDSMLRKRLWDYLIDVTRVEKASVIITTHYIAEAEKSDRVGLMRAGALLAEDSPKNIISHFGVNSLDEAFYEFCSKSTSDRIAGKTIEETAVSRETDPAVISQCLKKGLRYQVIQALIIKYFLQLFRQSG